MVVGLSSLPNIVANTASRVGCSKPTRPGGSIPNCGDRGGHDGPLELADRHEREHDGHEHLAAQGHVE